MTRRRRAARRSADAPAASPAPSAPGGREGLEALIAGLAAALALLWRYHDALHMTFLNDDFIFLDGMKHRSFLSLWGGQALFFNWWRPWSRELHYWILERLFGPSELAFHVVNFVLVAVAFGLFYRLARALLGPGRAAFATAAIAAMAAWAPPVMWAAGVQDLWMIVWSLGALEAWRGDRRLVAFLLYALALMSKETAAPLPALFLAWDVFVSGRSPRQALVRVLPVAVLVVPWAIAHPQIGGRLLRHVQIQTAMPASQLPSPVALARSVLALASLDSALAPRPGWGQPLLQALPAAALLGGLAVFGSRVAGGSRRPARGAIPFGIAWLVCGWAPLFLPGLGWHAYYGMFGSFGAWLALAALVRPGAIATTAILLFTVFSSAHDATASGDWGDGYYIRRAGNMLGEVRGMLTALVPEPAPHTRMWFSSLPNDIAFLSADAPALRVWYGDSTLTGGFLSRWRPPAPGSPAVDRFFKLKFEPAPHLIELRPGPENTDSARAADPEWYDDHMALGATFVAGQDWKLASAEYEKLAKAYPRLAEPAYNVAVCRNAEGDSTGFHRWLEEAYRRPVVSERLVRTARASGLTHW